MTCSSLHVHNWKSLDLNPQVCVRISPFPRLAAPLPAWCVQYTWGMVGQEASNSQGHILNGNSFVCFIKLEQANLVNNKEVKLIQCGRSGWNLAENRPEIPGAPSCLWKYPISQFLTGSAWAGSPIRIEAATLQSGGPPLTTESNLLGLLNSKLNNDDQICLSFVFFLCCCCSLLYSWHLTHVPQRPSFIIRIILYHRKKLRLKEPKDFPEITG